MNKCDHVIAMHHHLDMLINESEIGDCEAGMVIETADVKACPHGFVFIALCQECNLGN